MVSFFKTKKQRFVAYSMKVSTENDNNFGYEKITVLVDL